MPSALDPEQRTRVLGAKLTALVNDHLGDRSPSPPISPEPRPFGGGAAMVLEDTAYVLLDTGRAGVGAALAWAQQHDVAHLQLIVDDDVPVDSRQAVTPPSAGAVARQARLFARPPMVWRVVGRRLEAVEPAPHPDIAAPPDVALALVDELRAAGLDVVLDHGTVTGEVLGLEVARVIVDEGVARIEVGVGRNDREAFAMVHGDLPTAAALGSVIEAVRRQRRPGAPSHPLNRIAGERWLRAHLLADPGRLGSWSLHPVAGVVPRERVDQVVPALAAGTDDTGRPVVVACSVGIDLEVVPVAADAREMIAPVADLLIAVPARDAHPVTQRLAAALRTPAEVLPVEGDWRR